MPTEERFPIKFPVYFLAGDKEIDPSTGKSSVGKIPRIDVSRDPGSGQVEEGACLPLFSTEMAARLFAENEAAGGSRIRVAIKEPYRLIDLLELVRRDGASLVTIDPLQLLVGSIECLEIEEAIRILRRVRSLCGG